MDVIASRANSGQYLVRERRILLSTVHAWNKEGVAGSQKWLPYRPPGVFGVTGVRRQRQKRAIECWGIPQDVNAESSIDITHTLELEIQLSLSLAQHFLFGTHCFELNPSIARISFFLFFLLYNIVRSSSPVYEANIHVTKYHQNSLFTILHRNLTATIRMA
jgi:hypothetical protein